MKILGKLKKLNDDSGAILKQNLLNYRETLIDYNNTK